MLDDHVIRDFHHRPYSKEEFLDQIKYYNQENYNAYIGSDSKIVKGKVSMVTCVVFHKPEAGGKVFYIKEKLNRNQCPTLRSRMLLEAYRSIGLAMELEPLLQGKLEIHLDVGSDLIKNKTSAYENELQALVIGQGYSCAIKPNSWASSSVADKFVRS